MNKKQALQECVRLWCETALQGAKPDTHYLNDCPCCEYTKQFGDPMDELPCEGHCPLPWDALVPATPLFNLMPCEYPGTLYAVWEETNCYLDYYTDAQYSQAQHWLATLIAREAEKALAELEDN